MGYRKWPFYRGSLNLHQVFQIILGTQDESLIQVNHFKDRGVLR